MLCIGAPKGSGPTADQGSKVGDISSWAVCELAAGALPMGSRCRTTIRGDPGRVRSPSHSATMPSLPRSARTPTTRSALSICAVFSCVCCGMESTSTVQSSIGSARSSFGVSKVITPGTIYIGRDIIPNIGMRTHPGRLFNS